MDKSTYVVTGATGHTGNLIARTLLRNRKHVRVIGRNPDRLQLLVSNGAEPFVGDLTDVKSLTRAFAGASALYAMIPPNIASLDYRSFQNRVADAMACAAQRTALPYAVTLSSIGADKPEATGPIAGLHHLERAFNEIKGLYVLHLRAGYFMENTFTQASVAARMGMTAGTLRPDLALPMIATRDIASAAADALMNLDFRNSNTRELLGQRDLSMTEVNDLIVRAIGRPDLRYVRISQHELRGALTQLGMSDNVAGLFIEMCEAWNSGFIRPLEKRSALNTTPTSYETFLREEFLPLTAPSGAGGAA
jgi:uncharacterized protein YbjT (DUF2867 family)